MKLHQIIKDLRDEQGLTQEVLASRASLTRGYISRLESGDYTDGSPTIKTLQSIAQGLGVPLELILNRAGITKEDYINSNQTVGLVLRAKHNLNTEQVKKVEEYIRKIKNKIAD